MDESTAFDLAWQAKDSCHIWLFGLEEGTGKLPNVIREEGCTAYVRPILPSLVHPEDTVQREESGQVLGCWV